MVTMHLRMGRITYTDREKEILCDLVEQYKHILQNKSTNGTICKKKDEVWIKITNIFNAYDFSQRTPAQLRKCWQNLVQTSRKRHTEQKAHRLITGGGPPLVTGSDTIQEKVDAITAHCDVELLNSFDSTAAFERDHNIPPDKNFAGTYYREHNDDDSSIKFRESNFSFNKTSEFERNHESVDSFDTQMNEHFRTEPYKLNSSLNTINLNNEENLFNTEVKKILNEYCPQVKEFKIQNYVETLTAIKIAESIVQQREIHKLKLDAAKAESQILKLLKAEDSLENQNEENDA
ncbi:uncharacterized protein [Prorops nasuta]|uniref:uncharacterized protein n=1 Tax=Prorops nasuta TaxID=863751 RepID=UPI0034CE9AB6